MRYSLDKQIEWCIEQHHKTNHFYDNYLPYDFHLRMVVNVFNDFKHLLEKEMLREDIIEIACWGHDIIEDCRISYNTCRERLGKEVADIIYAVTNEKGKNRHERANTKYYEGIRNTKGAIFVKLCDRIANSQYSKLTKSSMFKKYKEENKLFLTSIDAKTYYPEMTKYLLNLFEN